MEHFTQGKLTGKWKMNSQYTITLYNFGIYQDEIYVMSRNESEVHIVHAPDRR
ncbi:hypothetical protein [Bacillus massilinigeriensis]|uniref:hypothetical protein n=1 Tax=Bacillus massilionigeriensis TaxID=1805475 RepID=UPI0013563613|nr:hypothetical protein [Bacillus massilionigeriensis]